MVIHVLREGRNCAPIKVIIPRIDVSLPSDFLRGALQIVFNRARLEGERRRWKSEFVPQLDTPNSRLVDETAQIVEIHSAGQSVGTCDVSNEYRCSIAAITLIASAQSALEESVFTKLDALIEEKVDRAFERPICEHEQFAVRQGVSVPGRRIENPFGRIRERVARNIKAEKLCCCVRCKPCLLYTSPSPRDQRGSRMPSSA